MDLIVLTCCSGGLEHLKSSHEFGDWPCGFLSWLCEAELQLLQPHEFGVNSAVAVCSWSKFESESGVGFMETAPVAVWDDIVQGDAESSTKSLYPVGAAVTIVI